MSSRSAGSGAADTPVSTALTARSSAGPPAICSMASRTVVPMASSPTPGRRTSPVTVHTMVPGDSGVPSSRNQSAPRATMWVTCARVSTLSTRAGGATVSGPGPAISTWPAAPLSLSTSASSSTTSTTPRR